MAKLDWKSYEELVKDIYEQLGKATGVKILGFGKDCKYKGKSQVEHQIDVLTSHSDGLHEYLTDIECKYWNEHINKDIVMKVEAIVKDCNFSKGIIVSKFGFTPDAFQYAKHVGIGLVELREMTDEDWKGRIRQINIHIVGHYPELMQCHIELENDTPSSSVKSGQMYGNAQLMIINQPSGSVVTLASFIENVFFKEVLSSGGSEPIVKSYNFETGTTITYQETGKTLRLKTITLTGKMTSMKEIEVISEGDEILYYMKCIFEDVEILLNKNGRIVKQIKQ